MKKISIVVLITALIVTFITGLFAPGIISWYFAPPVDLAVNCRTAVEWGIDTYRKTLLYGSAVGIVLGLALGLTVFRGRVTTPGTQA